MSSIQTATAMPVASAIASSSDAPTLTVDEILNGLRGLTMTELVRVSKAVALESEKKFKVFEKAAVKSKKPKKAGSMPKGVLPRQFLKPNAWKAFVMTDAKENGWPAFIVHLKRKNKETDEVTVEEVEFSASEVRDGVRVFDTGRPFNEKDAMSLSKIYWDNKAQSGSRKDLWDRFEAQYVEEPARSVSSSSASSSSSSSSATPVATPVMESAKPTVMKRVSKKTAPSS